MRLLPAALLAASLIGTGVSLSAKTKKSFSDHISAHDKTSGAATSKTSKATKPVYPSHAKSFEIKDGEFMVDGHPSRILSGEMHYARIPHQYWRHRMRMLKALGLNTVATYVFWNAHQPSPDTWDFSGDLNLREYIKIAGEEGLNVILRPGPYVCAEWEFGGYPWWLQNVEGMEVRRDNLQFLAATDRYLRRLYQEVGDLQVSKGGPIIMVQCENEFGSYVAQRKDIPLEEHRRYNAKIKQQLKDAGFDVEMFTSDGSWLFEGGATPGALPTCNGEDNIETIRRVVNEYHNGAGPYMVAEFYPGWLMHWCEPLPEVSDESVARQTEEYLKNNISFNLYMVHGGTNFGFTSGANYDKKHDIQPDLTSYDYRTLISEAGWANTKYDSVRNVIRRYVEYPLPEVPAPIPTIEIPTISLQRVTPVLSIADDEKCTESATPLTFEQLNQGHGYVLYSRAFTQPISGTLSIPGLRDFATVYVDGEKCGTLSRYTKSYDMDIDIPFNSTLQILVENMGRINYGPEIVRNNKGIISPVTISGHPISGKWIHHQLPMTTSGLGQSLDISEAMSLTGQPVMYEGTFTLTDTGDTFLDMSDWGKGIVFVNGHNLGRYWEQGPQQTLYLPGVWLREGKNHISILDQLHDRPHTTLRSIKTPILDNLRK